MMTGMPCSGPTKPVFLNAASSRSASSRAVGIERDDGIDRRTLLVVSGDAVEIHLHQLPRGQCAGLERCVNVFDRRLHDREGLAPLASIPGLVRRHHSISDWLAGDTLPVGKCACHDHCDQPMPDPDRFSLGSRMSRSPSPRQVDAEHREEDAQAGNKAIHHDVLI